MFCVTLPCLARTFIHFWTNLDQPINSVHPIASSCFLLFLYFRFSGYLKCSENCGKIILKISVTEPSRVIKKGRGAPPGSQEGCWRVPTLGRARDPPECLVGPLGSAFAYIYPSG